MFRRMLNTGLGRVICSEVRTPDGLPPPGGFWGGCGAGATEADSAEVGPSFSPGIYFWGSKN